MRRPDGSWIKPPPSYAPIQSMCKYLNELKQIHMLGTQRPAFFSWVLFEASTCFFDGGVIRWYAIIKEMFSYCLVPCSIEPLSKKKKVFMFGFYNHLIHLASFGAIVDDIDLDFVLIRNREANGSAFTCCDDDPRVSAKCYHGFPLLYPNTKRLIK